MPVQSLSFGKDTQNEWKSKRNNDSSQNNVIKILPCLYLITHNCKILLFTMLYSFLATYLRVSPMYKGIDVI